MAVHVAAADVLVVLSFPIGCLGEFWYLNELVSVNIPTYFYIQPNANLSQLPEPKQAPQAETN